MKYISTKSTARGFSVFKFADENCNVFISFSENIQNEMEENLVPGTCYIIKATIKRHSEDTYNPGNIKQNIINRVVVTKTIGNKDGN